MCEEGEEWQLLTLYEHCEYFQAEMMIWVSENSSRGRVAHMLGTEAEQYCTRLIHKK